MSESARIGEHCTTATSRCPACCAAGGSPCLSLRQLPVFCNVLWHSALDARRATRGDIELVLCTGCGLLFNQAFDPGLVEYADGYENALHFSPRFRDFSARLSERLVNRHRLQGGVAVEIGSGDGEFLSQLITAGMRRGLGFDPSTSQVHRRQRARQGIELTADVYRGQRAEGNAADLLLFRHVLEHIPQPRPWLRELRASVGPDDPVCYCEVPHGEWLLRSCSVWDVIYEHVTYWTPPALGRLFREAGFQLLDMIAEFDGQFLSVEARCGSPEWTWDGRDTKHIKKLETLSATFSERCNERLAAWHAMLSDLAERQRVSVVWGAGSKGITFANLMGDAAQAIAGLVDVNPRKHGKFVAGVGLPVLNPDALIKLEPDVVFVMNTVYENEIRSLLAERGLSSRLVKVMMPTASYEPC